VALLQATSANANVEPESQRTIKPRRAMRTSVIEQRNAMAVAEVLERLTRAGVAAG
jgi:hypothetical protein